LIVSLPADAVLTINGMLTRSTGSERSFITQELASGKDHQFILKCDFTRDGAKQSITRKLRLRAGATERTEFLPRNLLVSTQ
jgi:uncharacterized protein (TIGR03000 family)